MGALRPTSAGSGAGAAPSRTRSAGPSAASLALQSGEEGGVGTSAPVLDPFLPLCGHLAAEVARGHDDVDLGVAEGGSGAGRRLRAGCREDLVADQDVLASRAEVVDHGLPLADGLPLLAGPSFADQVQGRLEVVAGPGAGVVRTDLSQQQLAVQRGALSWR